MKCVKKTKLMDAKSGGVEETYEIKRVKDDVAMKMVREDGWDWCPKKLWKQQHPGRGKAAKEEIKPGKESTSKKQSKGRAKRKSSYRESKYKRSGMTQDS